MERLKFILISIAVVYLVHCSASSNMCTNLKGTCLHECHEYETSQGIQGCCGGKKCCACPGPVTPKCMDCICEVESGCNNNIGCVMDGGSLSCGPFQIKEVYWIDCGRLGGDYKKCANNYACAYCCVQRYMKRYIGSSGCPANCKTYARLHNGGPKGCTKETTLKYWEKIMDAGCDESS